jgi:outer membrane protein TolC
MYRLLLIIGLIIPVLVYSQAQDNDLGLEEFYQIVLENHPAAQQALLIRQRGELSVREARGSFDPKLVSNWDTKDYKEDDYYSIWDTYLQIPTIASIELKAGYERNNGTFVNPENFLPEAGLYYAGVTVPVGQGLFNNPRNINLQQSRLTQSDLNNQAVIVLNNLLLEANHTYWTWYEAAQMLELARNNLEVINDRFEGIRQSVFNGDLAPIDSVETLIQVQSFTNLLNKAEVDYQNSLLLLNNMIWGDSLQLEQQSPVYEDEREEVLIEFLDFAALNHPELRALSIQNSSLDLERKWNAEQLKPVLNLNYNFLIEREGSEDVISSNNYKGGIEFEFPLLIRKERAKLKMTKTKLEETQLKLQEKRREVLNKIEQNYNKVLVITGMITTQEEIVENYSRLLEGERAKFDNGESSIFLINSRENQKLRSDIKLIELKADYGRTTGMLYWSAGQLAELADVQTPEN